jgi:DNA invertase Pin-like site-specific DNA recombinase
VNRQTDDVRRLAERLGFTIDELIEEDDMSASRYARKRRPGWDKIMDGLEDGTISVLLAYSLDRISRRPDVIERLVDIADARDRAGNPIEIHVCSGAELDLSTGAGRMMVRMIGAMAAAEVDAASERQRNKLLHEARAGKPHWTGAPLGHTKTGKIVPAEAALIGEMLDAVIVDGKSGNAIANDLNARGILTKKGNQWRAGSVLQLVRSPRLVGLRSYHGAVMVDDDGLPVRGKWEPLVTMDRWKTACDVLDSRRSETIDARGVRRVEGRGRRSLFSGLVWCQTCGLPMARTSKTYPERTHRRTGEVLPKQKVPRWTCNRAAGVDGCRRSINAEPMESWVVAQVLAVAGDILVDAAAPAPDVDWAAAELADIDERLGVLTDQFMDGHLLRGAYLSAQDKAMARRNEIEATLGKKSRRTTAATVVGDPRTLTARWPDLTVDARRQVIRAVVDRIEIAPAVKKGRRPGDVDLERRVHVIWSELDAADET